MEQKMLRVVSVFLLVLTVVMCAALFYFPELHAYAKMKQEMRQQSQQQRNSVLDLLRDDDELLANATASAKMQKQLRLEIPKNVDVDDITFENKYIDQTIEITIPGSGNSYFYDYPMVGSCDNIVDLTYECEEGTGIVDIVLDGVYELDTTSDGQYLYIGFVDPHEIYEKIVVVDAGHGGNAPGAAKQGSNEKDIDLAIVLKLRKLFEQSVQNIGVYYTRTDDSNPSFASRVGLANGSKADLFLSIHNNSTASGRMSSINGTQVMYRVSDDAGSSQAFAKNCLDHLVTSLGSSNKGLVAGDDIYIIRTAEVPVALVEVGFMTNQQELDKLNSTGYQQQAAQALYDAIIKTLGE